LVCNENTKMNLRHKPVVKNCNICFNNKTVRTLKTVHIRHIQESKQITEIGSLSTITKRVPFNLITQIYQI